MLGPVRMAARWSLPSMKVSLGTKRLSFSIFSTTGWRPSVISSLSEWSTRGHAVVVLRRHQGEGRQHVGLGHGPGDLLDLGGLGGGLVPDLTEELVLQGHNPVLGGEDGVLQFLQLLGDVALAVHQGLLPDVLRGTWS